MYVYSNVLTFLNGQDLRAEKAVTENCFGNVKLRVSAWRAQYGMPSLAAKPYRCMSARSFTSILYYITCGPIGESEPSSAYE